MTVVDVPSATGESPGIPEERAFHRPWPAYAGTAFAPIRIAGKQGLCLERPRLSVADGSSPYAFR